jgi:anti-anti-sigma regulatory factor
LLNILTNARERNNMLRITENTENGKTVRLRLDGTVNSVSYSELEAACSRHQESAGKVILVDMAGVVFMNNEVQANLPGSAASS